MKSWVVMPLGTVLLLAEEAQVAISGQIDARLIIIASCAVTNDITSSDGSPIGDVGLLDFGSQGPTWTKPINANLSDAGNGTLQVSCNSSVTGFTVTIDGGTHGDGTTRRLDNATQTIPYQLFLDASGGDSPKSSVPKFTPLVPPALTF
ncbi:spore coat protein U domain-containing protein [Pseudomonas sp. PDM09]|uniref:spore coat protein U domain-containing protein n=1 Tax=Pseudomonas sp. PDM09 TaxID=2769270 RepID=UPI001782927E|nr:spore coat protein U domain-containing protein [Pseudomonas sp. PDM09]MBD9564103.1 spore coat protein U domain-containing protein [Pseudomonas sp. PDM09]